MIPARFVNELEASISKIQSNTPAARPVVWVEDVHAAPAQVVERLCGSLLDTRLPILYSDSNHEGFAMLRSCKFASSLYASRL